MRNAKLAMLALLAASAATFAGSAPAAAGQYTYCLSGAGYGYLGDCSYSSYAQCEASASGRLAYCTANPRAAYAQQAPRHRRSQNY
jgi:hypothetical protein